MKIVIPGDPIPKARARHFRRGNRVMTFDPQHEEKNHVRHLFQREMREAFDSDIKEKVMEASKLTYGKTFHLVIGFYMPQNPRDSEAQKNAKLWGFDPCNRKPDLSNLLKFYEDAANEVLYLDDSMIISCEMFKKYSTKPRTEINIMSLKELKLNPKAEGILNIFGPDKLKEFLTDVSSITLLRPNQVDSVVGDDREIWLTAAACVLSEFAIKYVDSLKKIRKFDGLVEEEKSKIQGLSALQNKSLNI
jgi:Holliday junction resolvase RusA-like endonuclease